MSKIKIFVLEDNKTEAFVIKLAFSGIEGIDVRNMSTARELLDSIHENPDIIILDLILPDMHGLALIKEIKKLNVTSRIVVISAQEDMEMVSKVQNEGVFNYIVKSESCLMYIKQVIQDLLVLVNTKK